MIRFDGKGDDLWVLALDGSIATRLTRDRVPKIEPLWSHDGKTLYYAAKTGDDVDIHSVAANGPDPPRKLFHSPMNQAPAALTPNGDAMLYLEWEADESYIGLLDLNTGEWDTYFDSPVPIFRPALSPDGKWLAYNADNDGVPGVFLHPFDSPNEHRLALGRGFDPIWTNTNALAFRAGGFMNEVEVMGDATIGERRPLYPIADYKVFYAGGRNFDVDADGNWIHLQRNLDPGQFVMTMNYRDVLEEALRCEAGP